MAKNMIEGICGLCLEKKLLAESHIIPEFMYKDLYDEKHKFYVLQKDIEDEKFKCFFKQKGYKSQLLCLDCEGFLNKYYETPFKNFWKDDLTFPDKFPIRPITFDANIEEEVFKLFHLLNIFRASICKDSIFNEISLGNKHEKILRKSILNRSLPEINFYFIGGIVVLDDNRKPHFDFIIPFQLMGRNNGHFYYCAIYGGVFWVFSISSHKEFFLHKYPALRHNKLQLLGVPYYEFPILKNIKKDSFSNIINKFL